MRIRVLSIILTISVIMSLAIVGFSINANADDLNEGFTCTITNDKAVITQGVLSPIAGTVALPITFITQLNPRIEYPIIGIGDNAIQNAPTSYILLRDGYEFIGNEAFLHCYNLERIDLANVRTIGEKAFFNCAKLTRVEIPAYTTRIGEKAFGYTDSGKVAGFTIVGYNNTSAQTYAIENGFVFQSLGDFEGEIPTEPPTEPTEPTEPPAEYVFDIQDDDTAILKEYHGIYDEAIIPDEYEGHPVVGIAPGAFFLCESIKYVTIPDSVKTIGEEAFKFCKKLRTVTFGKSIQTIENHAFFSCENLQSIYIPKSVTTIDYRAFGYLFTDNQVTTVDGFTIYGYKTSEAEKYANENGLNFVSLDNGPAYEYEVEDGNAIILKCYGAGSDLSIPSSIDGYPVTALKQYNIFADCDVIESVTIPDSVTEIWHAFYGCTNLHTVKLPDSLEVIGVMAFHGCSLTHIDIPDSVTKIDWKAFCGCMNMKEIYIPSSVTEISEQALGYYDYGAHKIAGFTIYGEVGSAAQTYAEENGFRFIVGKPEQQPKRIIGDADGSGEVDAVDATIIQRYATQIIVPYDAAQLMNADIDADGELTIVDATFIQRYCIKAATPYSIGEAIG